MELKVGSAMDVEDSTLNSEIRDLSPNEIANWLAKKLSTVFQVEVLDVDIMRPFSDFQMDSSVAVSISEEFSAWYGRQFPVTLFYEYPNIHSISEAFATVDDLAE